MRYNACVHTVFIRLRDRQPKVNLRRAHSKPPVPRSGDLGPGILIARNVNHPFHPLDQTHALMDRLQWLPTALTCSLVSLRADFTAYSHTAYSQLAAMVARSQWIYRGFAHPMTLTPKIFFVCKDFQGVYAATAVSWAVTGVSWATVERNALRIATMILRPLEVSW
jgi:hypothetical protein